MPWKSSAGLFDVHVSPYMPDGKAWHPSPTTYWVSPNDYARLQISFANPKLTPSQTIFAWSRLRYEIRRCRARLGPQPNGDAIVDRARRTHR